MKVCENFVMMLDVKTLARPTYQAAHELLEAYNQKYPGLLSVFTKDRMVSQGFFPFPSTQPLYSSLFLFLSFFEIVL